MKASEAIKLTYSYPNEGSLHSDTAGKQETSNGLKIATCVQRKLSLVPPVAEEERGAAAPARRSSSPLSRNEAGEAWRSAANLAMDKYVAGEDTFSALYQALAPRLCRYFVRRTGDAAQAEDLLQQTMLRIHCKRDLFFRGADVTPWVFAIAHRLLISSIRRSRCEQARKERLGNSTPSPAMGTDDVLHSRHVACVIERELAQLPDYKRIVIEMIKKDGLTMREVGDILGVSENAVKLRASRAYRTLRASVSRSEIGAEA